MSPALRTVVPSARVAWMDNLRVLVIAGVVVAHASTGYLGGADWYYTERTTSTVWATVLTVPATIGSLFALAPLFRVAGWLSAGSLARRGPGPFVRNRLLRLGLPLLVFVLVVDPLTAFVGGLGRGRDVGLWPFVRTRTPQVGPMWFVAALLAFSVAFGALRALRPARPRPGPALTTRALVVATTLLVVSSLLLWTRWPLDSADAVLNVRWGLWPQGAVLFGLGAHAREVTPELAPAPRTARRLGWASLALLALLGALAAVAAALEPLEGAPRGANPWTLGLALVYAPLSVTAALWAAGWSRRSLTSDRPVLRRAGRESYAAYFLHPLVLTTVMVAIAPVPLVPEAKFVLVSLVGVPCCFLAAQALLASRWVATVL